MLRLSSLPLSLVVFFYCLLCLPLLSNANKDFFTVYDLKVEGDYIDCVIDDLNGDGLNDGLFFHSVRNAGKVTRFFSVFYQDKQGVNQQADYRFEIAPQAVVYDVADVDPGPGKEILFFEDKGLFYYKMVDGGYDATPVLLFETPSIFKLPDQVFLERLDFARDLNRDGVEEIMIPQFHQYVIYSKQSAGTYAISATLDCPVQNSIKSLMGVSRTLISTFLTPNTIIFDYNRDQRNDIVTVHDNYLKIFFQNNAGEFSNTDAAVVHFDFDLTQAYSSISGPGQLHERDRLKDKIGITSLTDLNNDGLLDMIIEKFSMKDGALNPKKQFQIYFGRQNLENPHQGGIFNNVPDHIIINRGLQIYSKIGDLNNDGKMDIYIPIIEIGVLNFISMLVTGDIEVTVLWYVMDDSGRYRIKPDFELGVTFELDTKGRKFPVSNIDGDYNGDGRKDFLRSQNGKLMIHYAPDDGVPKETADVEFEIEIPDNGLMVSPGMVNADSKSDVIMIFVPTVGTEEKGKVKILVTS
ncbi:MAG: VCBS repeat-containing protein [Desulfobacteraceae bacterium]|nr:MAG: VCBS repeat-containing protein [Desulfobacteraceae bacterium]